MSYGADDALELAMRYLWLAALATALGLGAPAAAGAAVEILDLRDQPRCDRSWKRDGTVRTRSDGGMLSDRDAAALDLT